MNANEPVFWTCGLEEDEAVSNALKIKLGLEYYNIPLYTHPANTPTLVLDGNRVYPAFKTLTDEEITAVSKEIFKDYKNFHHYQIDFARAILRKAQEK